MNPPKWHLPTGFLGELRLTANILFGRPKDHPKYLNVYEKRPSVR